MLKLKPNPTFRAKVDIVAPGGEKHPVTFEFKHRTKDELQAFLTSDAFKEAGEADSIMLVASGWDGVDAPFNADTLREFCQNYHNAAGLVILAYAAELTQAKLGN